MPTFGKNFWKFWKLINLDEDEDDLDSDKIMTLEDFKKKALDKLDVKLLFIIKNVYNSIESSSQRTLKQRELIKERRNDTKIIIKFY